MIYNQNIPCFDVLANPNPINGIPGDGLDRTRPPWRQHFQGLTITFLWVFVLSCFCGKDLARGNDSDDFFERQVRPLLTAQCAQCHGEEDPEGGLRLTTLANVLKGGKSGPAAIAKNPSGSLLIRALEQTGKLKMPPDEKLGLAEIEVMKKWVALGMPWPINKMETGGLRRKAGDPFAITDKDRLHWSFRPVASTPVPKVNLKNWPQNGLDAHALFQLESKGLPPHEKADRPTLLRRVYFDLIGLPPTWAEVSDFVKDPAPTSVAFQAVLDRLLASPRYGERWGRHWLDVARFADTKDGVLMFGDERVRPFAYTYRDYVIRAFNEDMRFDQFVQDQIAADLIEPKVEPWRLAAMGFLTLGRMFDNNIHDIIDDQIDTVSRGFLGLTVACARCHDHKYDPISTADYYSLYGIFASSEERIDLPPTGVKQAPESAEFEKQYGAKREEAMRFQQEQFKALTEVSRQRIGDYLVHVATTKPDPLETAIFFLSLSPDQLRPPTIARWRRYLDQPGMDQNPVFGPWHQLLKGDGSLADLDPRRVAEARKLWEKTPVGTGTGQINPVVRSALAKATLKSRQDVAQVYGRLFKEAYEQSKKTPPSQGTKAETKAWGQLLEIVISPNSPPYFPKGQVRRYMSREQTDQYGGKLKDLDVMAVKSPHARPRAMVLNDSETPYDPHIFVRGNPTQPGRKVPRQFLELFGDSNRKPFGPGSGRLDLARAITDPKNPLTARVLVNRVWMHHFGEPLVSSPSDFGNRSTAPQQGDLLDYLTIQFVQGGWSIKNLHRLILQSATWQQASSHPDGMPNDLNLAPRRQRLSFETMRDSLLLVSGRLEYKNAGRPVDLGDPKSRCQTIFGLVDRQSLPGMFRAFDFASPDQSVERRSRTMVPQQTLFALNSPFVMEQTKALMLRLDLTSLANPSDRMNQLYRIILSRMPTIQESQWCLEFVGLKPDSGSVLTRWEQLAQVLLCSNEFMYVD